MNVTIIELMKYSPVFFYGKADSGKTYLLKDIARSFKKIHKKTCLYATAKDFGEDIVSAIRNHQKELFEQKYRNNSLLIIDGLQFLAGKPKMQEELLIILKELQVKNRQVILVANRHPKCILGLGEELVDSCYGGLMLEV